VRCPPKVAGRPGAEADERLAFSSFIHWTRGYRPVPLNANPQIHEIVDAMATIRFSFTFSTATPTSFGPFPRWFVGQDPMLVAALNEAQMTASRSVTGETVIHARLGF
jgi:hypothetical protein